MKLLLNLNFFVVSDSFLLFFYGSESSLTLWTTVLSLNHDESVTYDHLLIH